VKIIALKLMIARCSSSLIILIKPEQGFVSSIVVIIMSQMERPQDNVIRNLYQQEAMMDV